MNLKAKAYYSLVKSKKNQLRVKKCRKFKEQRNPKHEICREKPRTTVKRTLDIIFLKQNATSVTITIIKRD